MPPRDHHLSCIQADTLQERAAMELEAMRDTGKSSNLHRMPPACFRLLKSLPGNHLCIDCGARHPEWATVSYGALICIDCSGRHRSLGVQVSCTKTASKLVTWSFCLWLHSSLFLFRSIRVWEVSQWIIGRMNKCWPCWKVETNSSIPFFVVTLWVTCWESDTRQRRHDFIENISANTYPQSRIWVSTKAVKRFDDHLVNNSITQRPYNENKCTLRCMKADTDIESM